VRYLHIVVEGDTEERFVNDLLAKHFANFGTYVHCRKLRTGWSGNVQMKGGLLKYPKFRDDVLRWIRADRNRDNVWYSSMIDLYGFPVDDQSPYSKIIRLLPNAYDKVAQLEEAIAQDINHDRFIPYIQLHEFEALVLVDPEKLLDLFIGENTQVVRLKREIAEIPPELINDDPHSAPSKRIQKYLPPYEKIKSFAGPLIAEEIGLTTIREACPHFNQWISKLEELSSS